MSEPFDIVVIGGGHAGAEAAHAAGRMGARVALVTMSVDAIGRMSCNPAIGGLGKGQMVREIDALGGLMGRVTDATGIQFRTLNRRKGPAVRAPRAQADRELYAAEVQRQLLGTPNVTIVEGVVDDIVTTDDEPRRVRGVLLADGRRLDCAAVIVTTGTFLRALMHCGATQTPGGRVGEGAATGLSGTLQRLGLELARLKTGTPPRIHRDTVDYDSLESQPGETPPPVFSFMTRAIDRPQVDCWITYTNDGVHELIRDNLHLAPMYSGQIKSRGPRYCPSIEDKVVRFADKSRHQIFLEPEGVDNERIYCNGISTSLPAEVQETLVHQIEGLERARILQPGYAVEYDCVPTHQIDGSLQTRAVRGLYLAGQINGTSGYEEAAGQGLLAGINAVRALRGEAPLVLGRHEAYLGVMIDDLVTSPPDEPYRMFTSRAEYRMLLRSDNADERLTPVGRRIGLVDDARWAAFGAKRALVDQLTVSLSDASDHGVRLIDLLRRPDVSIEGVLTRLSGVDFGDVTRDVLESVESRVKYAGYLEREARAVEKSRSMESRRIPDAFRYQDVSGLRTEAREKLARLRPSSLGQAARISGVSPADLTILAVALKR